MEVKIQCPCGTRFAFEVEPVNSRMPVRINCPGCDADGTDLANEVIRQQLEPVAAAPAPVPLEIPAPARKAPMRVAVSQPQPASEPAAEGAFCPRHLENVAVDTCRVCGKPICGECMEHFGYVCSSYCRTQAARLKIDLPVYKKQRAVVQARLDRTLSLIWRTSVSLGVVFLGVWIWYTFFGSHPRLVYSEALPHGDRARFYQLLTPNQVLSMKADRMTLFDVAQKKQVWSVALNVGFTPPPKLDPAEPLSEEVTGLYPEPRIIATTNDLWILFASRLVQYDRRSGNSKQEVPLNPPFFGLTQNDTGFTLISGEEPARRTITRVAFADGTVQTEPVQPARAEPLPVAVQAKPHAGPAKPSGAPTTPGKIMAAVTNALPVLARSADWEGREDQFAADGTGIMQMKVDLIERRTITHQAMKTQTKKSMVDENLTAGQSMEATEQMMNEMRRDQTGGVEEEDVSRYQVALHQLAANPAPDWSGEVTGSPSFYLLKTKVVLAAGNSVQVFDRNNKKLWAASLTYSVPPHYSWGFDAEESAPCVESGNNLYVFDRGMLTSFDAATGAVHWRLTSVGISELQLDARGQLYVTSTTASPDSLQFSQQVNFSARANPVILKVDAATGRVLWRTEGIGDRCFVSGKYVYTSRATQNPLTGPGEDPVLYFDLYRLSASDGHAMWDYSQPRHPVQIELQGNEILLHFRGELQVLKFLSL